MGGISGDGLQTRLQRDPENTVKELEAEWARDPQSLDANQTLAEVHFELGNAETALKFLTKSVELDPEGDKGGYDKFLWLGQLLGGHDGVRWYQKGIEGLHKLSAASSDAERRQLQNRICLSLVGIIEIWMTDLCMAPQAEEQCERLVTDGFMLNDASPELWAALGSIRISQQRSEEAKQALRNAWEFYENESGETDQLSWLIRLAQSMLEVSLLEEALEVAGELHRLDELVPDAYYLTAVAHQQLCEETEAAINNSKAIDPSVSANKALLVKLSKHIVAARDACILLSELPPESLVESEMIDAARQIAESLIDPPVADPWQDEEEEEQTAIDAVINGVEKN